jgi:hypothetical protein
MNEDSQYLLGLAQSNAQIYTTHPHIRAIIVSGSVAEGLSDRYSDIDTILYYEQLPTKETLQQAFEHNQGNRYRLLGEQAGEALLESYEVHGVECQFAHTTIAAWEQEMALVLEQLEVATPLQKALAGMLDALPLYGEPLFRQWQARIVNYPDALAQAMVKHYLAFFPLWALQQRFATRDALLWQYQAIVEAEQHILGILAGLNRLYYTTFQFKRMRHLIGQMHIVPSDLASRLDGILQTPTPEALVQLVKLIRETVALVEQHMPQIDTSSIQRLLNLQEKPWEPMKE